MLFDNALSKVRATAPGADSLLPTYCGLGKRLKKTGTADTTAYVYDGIYAVCEFDGSENLKVSYVYANGLLLATMEVPPGGTSYYHHDGLGSIVGLTDETGNVAQAYIYDEFGNLIESWGGVDNHYLYTGQEWDSEIADTELYNLRARYHDTEVGRFISEDPELQVSYSPTGLACPACGIGGGPPSWFMYRGNPQELSAYPYVLNNPVNLTDPMGERVQVCDKLLRLKGYHQWIRFEGGPYTGEAWGFVQKGSPYPPRWLPAEVRPETATERFCHDISQDDCKDECVHRVITFTKAAAQTGTLKFHIWYRNCRWWVGYVRTLCGI